MAWEKLTLTTAENTIRLGFGGRGSIYAEGSFGGGSVELHLTYVDVDGSTQVSTGFIDEAIDGTTIKSIDCPRGTYELQLNGSVGATVDVYINEQFSRVID